MNRPTIIVSFHGEQCTWHSVGWGGNKKLMEQAKRLINKGNTEQEVVQLLEQNGFAVVEQGE